MPPHYRLRHGNNGDTAERNPKRLCHVHKIRNARAHTHTHHQQETHQWGHAAAPAGMRVVAAKTLTALD